MKKIKLYENFQTEDYIYSVCIKYGIENWSISEDGLVDVDGNVSFYSKNIENIPLMFGKVNGDFNCSVNKLTSLKGCPKYVGGNLYISFNKFESLEYSPEYVAEDFVCSNNENMTTLEGISKNIGGILAIHNCPIKSLKYLPTDYNGDLYVYETNIESFIYCPRSINILSCGNNMKLYTFNDLSNVFIKRKFDCEGSLIENVYKLFNNKEYIELLDFYDPFEPPKEPNGKPILHLDILNEFLDEIGKPLVDNVDGSVIIINDNYKELPLQFGNVSGLFSCQYLGLTTLKGCPNYVGGIFNIEGNQLKSIDFCPTYVGSHIYASVNRLTTLYGLPERVNGSLFVNNNDLTTFEGCPKYIDGSLECKFNFNLYTFKGLGDTTIKGNLICHLTHIHKIWRLFVDVKYIELLDFYDPFEPPTEPGGNPILHLDILNEFLDEIDGNRVSFISDYILV